MADINELIDDPNRGASRNARFALSGISDPKERLSVLQQFYPDAVATDDMGIPDNFLITHDDGITSLFDEQGLSWGDMTDLSALTSEVGYGILGGLAGLIGGPFAPALSVAGGVAGGEFGRQLHDERVDRILPQPRNRSFLDRLSDNKVDIGMEAGIGTLAEWGMNKLVPGSGTIARSVGQGIGRMVDTGIDAPPQNFKSPHGWDVEFVDDIGETGLREDVGIDNIPNPKDIMFNAENNRQLRRLILEGLNENRKMYDEEIFKGLPKGGDTVIELPMKRTEDIFQQMDEIRKNSLTDLEIQDMEMEDGIEYQYGFEEDPFMHEVMNEVEQIFTDKHRVKDYYSDDPEFEDGIRLSQSEYDQLTKEQKDKLKPAKLFKAFGGQIYRITPNEVEEIFKEFDKLGDDFKDHWGDELMEAIEADLLDNIKTEVGYVYPDRDEIIDEYWGMREPLLETIRDVEYPYFDLYPGGNLMQMFDERIDNFRNTIGQRLPVKTVEEIYKKSGVNVDPDAFDPTTIMKEDVGLSAPVLRDDVISKTPELINAEKELFDLTGGDFPITDFADDIQKEIDDINLTIKTINQKNYNIPVDNLIAAVDFYKDVLENTKVYIWGRYKPDDEFDPEIDYFEGTRSELIKEHGSDEGWSYGGGMAFTGEHRATLEDMAKFHAVGDDLAYGDGAARGMYGIADTIYRITGDRTPNEYSGMVELRNYFDEYRINQLKNEPDTIMKEDVGLSTPLLNEDLNAGKLEGHLIAARQAQKNPKVNDTGLRTGSDINQIGKSVSEELAKPQRAYYDQYQLQEMLDSITGTEVPETGFGDWVMENVEHLADDPIGALLWDTEKILNDKKIIELAESQGLDSGGIGKFYYELIDTGTEGIPSQGYSIDPGEIGTMVKEGVKATKERNIRVQNYFMDEFHDNLPPDFQITDNSAIKDFADRFQTNEYYTDAKGIKNRVRDFINDHKVNLWQNVNDPDAPGPNVGPDFETEGLVTKAELNKQGFKTVDQGGDWQVAKLFSSQMDDYRISIDDFIEELKDANRLRQEGGEDWRYYSVYSDELGTMLEDNLHNATGSDFPVSYLESYFQMEKFKDGRSGEDDYLNFIERESTTPEEIGEELMYFGMYDPEYRNLLTTLSSWLPPEHFEALSESLINTMGYFDQNTRKLGSQWKAENMIDNFDRLGDTYTMSELSTSRNAYSNMRDLILLLEDNIGSGSITSQSDSFQKIMQNQDFRNWVTENLGNITDENSMNAFIAQTIERFGSDPEIMRMINDFENQFLFENPGPDLPNKDNLTFENQNFIGVMP